MAGELALEGEDSFSDPLQREPEDIGKEDSGTIEKDNNEAHKQEARRVSFMALASSPTLARAAMVQSQLGVGDENIISEIASDPKESTGDVSGAVAKAVLRESQVDHIISRRMLKRALLIRKTLERCAKSLKEAARARYSCTVHANLASRSMFDYLARLNNLQGQSNQEEEDTLWGRNGGAPDGIGVGGEGEEAIYATGGGGGGGGNNSHWDELLEVGQTFMSRLERVIIPPASLEEDEACAKLLSGAQRLVELSRGIQAVVKDLEQHQKSCPSAQELLRAREVQQSADHHPNNKDSKDPWLAACEYNVLLRRALHANRERRGLCERLAELVEQKQVSVLHQAISAIEETLRSGSVSDLDGGMDKLGLLSSALVNEKTSSVSETNQAGNSVDALLEQRLIECAGSLFDDKRPDVIRQGLLEIQLGSTASSSYSSSYSSSSSLAAAAASASDGSSSAWHTVRAVITAGGHFYWFGKLIQTANGLDGLLTPQGSLAIKGGLSVEPGEAPLFDLVEPGKGWGRSKKTYRFRAMNIEDSVEWILLFKDLSQNE